MRFGFWRRDRRAPRVNPFADIEVPDHLRMPHQKPRQKGEPMTWEEAKWCLATVLAMISPCTLLAVLARWVLPRNLMDGHEWTISDHVRMGIFIALIYSAVPMMDAVGRFVERFWLYKNVVPKILEYVSELEEEVLALRKGKKS